MLLGFYKKLYSCFRIYDKRTFDSINSHYETGEKVTSQIDLEGVRKHMAGLRLCQEMFKAQMDLHMHTRQLVPFVISISARGEFYPRSRFFQRNVLGRLGQRIVGRSFHLPNEQIFQRTVPIRGYFLWSVGGRLLLARVVRDVGRRYTYGLC